MNQITKAVRELRERLGDTQQAFAYRLGLAIATAVRYESTRPPQGKALVQMYRVAYEAGHRDLAETFWVGLHADLGLSQDAGQRINTASVDAHAAAVYLEKIEELGPLTREQRKYLGKAHDKVQNIRVGLDPVDPYSLNPKAEREEPK